MEVPRKLRKLVSASTLDAIARAVEEAEAKTSGEIVVHIVRNLLPLETPRRRANRAFVALGIQRTQKRNGILLFLVMNRKRFEIVADDGIDSRTGPAVWEAIAAEISRALEREGFEAGVCRGVALLGEALKKHFPREPGALGQLPDRPRVEES